MNLLPLLPLPPKKLIVNYQLELGIMLNKLDTTDKQDQSRESNKDTLSTGEAELEEMTDLESKEEEEEILVTSETNSIPINMKNPLNKS